MSAPRSLPRQPAGQGVALGRFGLHTAAGDQPFALFAAAGAGLSLARPDAGIEAPGHDGLGREAVMACPVLEDLEIEYGERLAALALPALAGLLEEAGPGAAARDTRILLLLPSQGMPRGAFLSPGALAARLRQALDLPADQPLEVHPLAGSLTGELRQAAQALSEGQAGCILFGAVDSLLDPLTLEALGRERRLLTGGTDGGCVPGEAAVFVELLPSAGAPSGCPRITAFAEAEEPEAGRPDETRLQGLQRMLSQLAEQAGHSIEALDCLALPLAGEPHRALEWFQAANRLWPLRLDETRRLAMQQGEADAPQPDAPEDREILDPAGLLGDTGIVEPLLGLALACARFEFAWAPLDRAAVVETPDGGRAPLRAGMWVMLQNEEDQARKEACKPKGV